jgi:prevent-host-death family protein
MIKLITAKDARDRFAEILSQVHEGKETIIVEEQGKPVAAVIDMEQYDRLIQAWNAPFAVIDQIRAKNQNKDPEQVQQDVAAAVAKVRAAPRINGRKPA